MRMIEITFKKITEYNYFPFNVQMNIILFNCAFILQNVTWLGSFAASLTWFIDLFPLTAAGEAEIFLMESLDSCPFLTFNL